MTALRQRLTDDLTLCGYAQRTISAYVAAVARLSQFFQVAPDALTEEQLTVGHFQTRLTLVQSPVRARRSRDRF